MGSVAVNLEVYAQNANSSSVASAVLRPRDEPTTIEQVELTPMKSRVRQALALRNKSSPVENAYDSTGGDESPFRATHLSGGQGKPVQQLGSCSTMTQTQSSGSLAFNSPQAPMGRVLQSLDPAHDVAGVDGKGTGRRQLAGQQQEAQSRQPYQGCCHKSGSFGGGLLEQKSPRSRKNPRREEEMQEQRNRIGRLHTMFHLSVICTVLFTVFCIAVSLLISQESASNKDVHDKEDRCYDPRHDIIYSGNLLAVGFCAYFASPMS